MGWADSRTGPTPPAAARTQTLDLGRPARTTGVQEPGDECLLGDDFEK